jgi:hypothetical protein
MLMTACSTGQESAKESYSTSAAVSSPVNSAAPSKFYHSICGAELDPEELVMCLIKNNLDSEIGEVLASENAQNNEFVDTMYEYSELYSGSTPKVEELADLREKYLRIHSKVLKLMENNKISSDEMSIITEKLDNIIERRTADATTADSKAKGYIEAYIGMTAEELRNSKSWGEPNRINRTTTASGVREQWVYYGRYVYLEDGIVTSIQE